MKHAISSFRTPMLAGLTLLLLVLCGCRSEPLRVRTPSSPILTEPKPGAIFKDGPFADYDNRFTSRVDKHWAELLSSHGESKAKPGKIVVKCRLQPDGSVTDLEYIINEVGEPFAAFAKQAVLDCVPFDKWPAGWDRIIGDHREVTFTFYHH